LSASSAQKTGRTQARKKSKIETADLSPNNFVVIAVF
jgi:hypothetical protein